MEWPIIVAMIMVILLPIHGNGQEKISKTGNGELTMPLCPHRFQIVSPSDSGAVVINSITREHPEVGGHPADRIQSGEPEVFAGNKPRPKGKPVKPGDRYETHRRRVPLHAWNRFFSL